MFKGRWFFILAFGGLAHAQDAPVVLYNDAVLVCDDTGCREGSVNQTGKIREKENSTSKANNDTGISQNWFVIEPSSHKREQVEGKTKDETERAIRDVNAQEEMVLWAQVSAGVAFLALIGLLATLYETRSIGRAQTRAYLNVPQITLYLNDDRFDLVIGLDNCGQSPAQKIRIEIDEAIYFLPEINDGKTDLVPETFNTNTIDVRPIAAQSVDPITDSTNKMHKVVLNRFESHQGISLEISGTVYWQDVFKKRDKHRYSFFLKDLSIHDFKGGASVQMLVGEIPWSRMPD